MAYGMKRLLCALLALCMLFSATALAEAAEAVEEASRANGPVYYEHEGRVTLIDGACVDTPIDSFEDAALVVDSVLDRLGGDERTQLDPWRILLDAYGNRYYVFQQMYNDTTVLGGAVKVITGVAGDMLGLTSSIVSELPEARDGEDIGAEEAEKLVLDRALQLQGQALNLVDGLTDRMILPITLEVDMEAEDTEGSRYVWVVYTDNPASSLLQSSDLPYLAHYVTLDGEYLYSLPTIIPGDEAGASGFDASYVFEFMEPVQYNGYVDLSSGEEMEISIDVMRDRRTGMYYLGNLERRIVVADCWEFLYGGNRVVLEASPDNLEWDQTGLLTLYNYCRAYDYYEAIGWIGGDGLATPIMVLNNYCDQNHVPVDNAAYVGGYLGWQLFLASQANDYSQCLDVLAHEFTHCVTGSIMTYNAYMNDYGAINEAMSDIQGKTCQMLMDGAENVSWTLGDKSKRKVRSMEEPHRYQQPQFSWDLYYTPNTKIPTILNDEGGVHSNSSLLNYLAYRLYEKGGMDLREGRAFWFTVDCAMVPGTDYPQLAELLPWALRAAGLQQYEAELQQALDATRLGVGEVPEVFDEDRALLTLTLPENELFSDGQWLMMLFSVNLEKLIEAGSGILGKVMMGDYSDLPQFMQEMMEDQKLLEAAEGDGGDMLDNLMNTFMNANVEQSEAVSEEAEQEALEMLERMKTEMSDWMREHMEGVFYSANTNGGQDGRTMRMMGVPGYAVPILIHGVYNENTSALNDTAILVCLGGMWIDVGALIKDVENMDPNAEGAELPAGLPDDLSGLTDELPEELKGLLEKLEKNITNIFSIDDALSLVFYRIKGGEVNELPAEGLDAIQPKLIEMPSLDLQDKDAQPKKSRPKLPEESAEKPAEEAAEPAEEAAEEPAEEAAEEPAEEAAEEPVEEAAEPAEEAAEPAEEAQEELPDAA